MVDGGGIGAFAGGFAKSFAVSRENRRLRDLDLMRQQQREAHEERLGQQFREQQDFRVEQQKAVEEYRAGQMQLQEKQAAIQKKKLDLDIMSGMEKAFDPKTPKAQRQFILKQTFKTLEIDPKSQEAKDFLAMASGLDDEALKETRSAMLTLMPDASPGQITAFTHAIVSGKMQMKDALEEFNKAKQAKKLEEINSRTGGGGGPAAKSVKSVDITSPVPIEQQQPKGFTPAEGQSEGEPTAGGANPQQIRDRAAELFSAGFTTEGTAQLQLARDLEADQKIQTKVIKGPDGKDVYAVDDASIVGQEAPSGRPVKTPEEERLSKAGEESVKADYARVKPWLDDATTAKDTAPLVQAFKTANKSRKFVSGSFSDLRENVTKIAELVGVDSAAIEKLTGVDIGDPAVAETMKSASAQIGILLADKLGRATNMQVGYIQESLPSLLKTPRGNEIAIELLEKANDRAIQVERLYDDYQDKHGGDLRPKGKPSFFAEADRIRREPLVSEELEKEIKSEAKKGGAIDVDKLWEKGKKEVQILIGEDTYEKVGQTKKGLPIVKVPDTGQQFPYAATKEDASKAEPGEWFLFNDPEEGPTMVRRKKRVKDK